MKRLSAILLSIGLFFTSAFAAERNPAESEYISIYFDLLSQFVETNYKFGVTQEQLYKDALQAILDKHPEVLDDAFDGMAETLDPYSIYISPEEYQPYIESIVGEFVGIGVGIQQIGDYIEVITVYPDTGAAAAGIEEADRLISVNGENVVGKTMEYVRSLIVGEEGTTVKIGILRGDQTLELDVTRTKVSQISVDYRITEDNIGYIILAEFNTNTPEQLKEILDTFDANNITKVILDLRGNPGGEEKAVVACAEFFVESGPIMRIEYAGEDNTEILSANNPDPYSYDMVVLVDENSASAAEVFAGTMKDYGVATLVGQTTYGKGSVQTIQPLTNGGAFKFTVATYTTASENPVNGVGIEPDYIVDNKVRTPDEHPFIEPMHFDVTLDTSDPAAVKAVCQRLSLLGLYRGDTESGEFTPELTTAISRFQEASSIEATGVADINTLIVLDNATCDLNVLVDYQYEKAVELLTGQTDTQSD